MHPVKSPKIGYLTKQEAEDIEHSKEFMYMDALFMSELCQGKRKISWNFVADTTLRSKCFIEYSIYFPQTDLKIEGSYLGWADQYDMEDERKKMGKIRATFEGRTIVFHELCGILFDLFNRKLGLEDMENTPIEDPLFDQFSILILDFYNEGIYYDS